MSIFKPKKEEVKVDPIERLQRESESAISIFTDTKLRLEKNISSVEVEEAKEQSIIDAAEARKKDLEEIKTKSLKFIGKINQLFD